MRKKKSFNFFRICPQLTYRSLARILDIFNRLFYYINQFFVQFINRFIGTNHLKLNKLFKLISNKLIIISKNN